MLRLVSPVDHFAARQLYADCVREGLVKPRLGQLIARQLAEAAMVGFAEGEQLLALMTATPADIRVAGLPTLEISVCGRRDDCAGQVLPMMRLARLTLAAWLQDGTIALCCVIRDGHRPGQRLAHLAGFKRAGTEKGLELWTRSPCRQS
jgi:hypothetical protein